jgi:hypothetical protein
MSALAAAPSGEVADARYGNQSSQLDFFAPGATSRARSITTVFDNIWSLAYQPDGSLWVHGYIPNSAFNLGYVKAGGNRVTLVTFPGAPSEGPIATDGTGNIVMTFSGLLQAYSAAGTPVYTLQLAARPKTIDGFAFSRDGKLVYVADPHLEAEVFRVGRFAPLIAAFGTYSAGLVVGSY